MTNLLMFYGSCGHITIEEVTDDEWSTAAENNYSVSCADESARMVYVHPVRFFLCIDCVEEELYDGEFETLRFFFQSTEKYFRQETEKDREQQTILLGRSMLPSFSDERILAIAKKQL